MAMSLSTAVILAAGLGTRLAGTGKNIPKGFVVLGELPIVEESVQHLLRAGIRRIIIVTGHLWRCYEELAHRYPNVIYTIHNPHYANSGSMYSLFVARNRIDGDFLLVESDLVYEPRALTVCLASNYNNVVVMSGPTGAGDEVYAETEGNRLLTLSKLRHTLATEPAGEFIGISKISQTLYGQMCRYAEKYFSSSRYMEYDSDCFVALARNHAIHGELIPDLVWSEIDNESQLQRARDLIYPHLVAQTCLELTK